jgi:hypothetical protein
MLLTMPTSDYADLDITPKRVISERLLTADETFPFIAITFARGRPGCKGDSGAF